MSNTLVPKSRIVEAACRTDFLSFFQWCFHTLQPGSTLNMNWHHRAMAYHLELVLRGRIKRLIIAAPSRTLKSLMASVALPAYMLGRNPAARVIGISHSTDLATKFSNECRALVDSTQYHRFFPEVQLSKNTENEFHTTYGGYRYARSAEGSLTGIGGGLLVPDDFQNRWICFRNRGERRPITFTTAQWHHVPTTNIEERSSLSGSVFTWKTLLPYC